jgi:hypothetical protein
MQVLTILTMARRGSARRALALALGMALLGVTALAQPRKPVPFADAKEIYLRLSEAGDRLMAAGKDCPVATAAAEEGVRWTLKARELAGPGKWWEQADYSAAQKRELAALFATASAKIREGLTGVPQPCYNSQPFKQVLLRLEGR